MKYWNPIWQPTGSSELNTCRNEYSDFSDTKNVNCTKSQKKEIITPTEEQRHKHNAISIGANLLCQNDFPANLSDAANQLCIDSSTEPNYFCVISRRVLEESGYLMQPERDPHSPDEKEEDDARRVSAFPSSQSRIIPAIECALQSRYENRTTYFENENEERERIAPLWGATRFRCLFIPTELHFSEASTEFNIRGRGIRRHRFRKRNRR